MGLFRTNSFKETNSIVGCIPGMSIFSIMYNALKGFGLTLSFVLDNTNDNTINRVTYTRVDAPHISYTRDEKDNSGGLFLLYMTVFLIAIGASGFYGSMLVIHEAIKLFYSLGIPGWVYWAIQIPIVLFSLRKFNAFRCAKMNSDGKSDEWAYWIVFILTISSSVFILFNVVTSSHNEIHEFVIWTSPLAGFLVYHLLTKPLLTAFLILAYQFTVKADTKEAKDYVAYLQHLKDVRNAEMLESSKQLITSKKAFGLFSVGLMIIMPFVFLYLAVSPELNIINGNSGQIYTQYSQEKMLDMAMYGAVFYPLIIGIGLLFSSVNSMPFIGSIVKIKWFGRLIVSIAGLAFIYFAIVLVPINFLGTEKINFSNMHVKDTNLESNYYREVYFSVNNSSPIVKAKKIVEETKFDTSQATGKKGLDQANEERNAKKYWDYKAAILISLPVLLYMIYKFTSLAPKGRKFASLFLCFICTLVMTIGAWKGNLNIAALPYLIFNDFTQQDISRSNYSSNKEFDEAIDDFIKEKPRTLPMANLKSYSVVVHYRDKNRKASDQYVRKQVSKKDY